MKTLNTIADKKLAALLQRQTDIKAALKQVRERRKAAAERDAERLALIVGRAVLSHAARKPEFDGTLRAALKVTVTEGERDFAFLQSRGLV
ncbi:MAG TPA: hypothetical protein VGN17_02145 [Bryobacteraceae bacterium]|jgi:hypothetical protein